MSWVVVHCEGTRVEIVSLFSSSDDEKEHIEAVYREIYCKESPLEKVSLLYKFLFCFFRSVLFCGCLEAQGRMLVVYVKF